jgi:hypothetical protein
MYETECRGRGGGWDGERGEWEKKIGKKNVSNG